MEYKTYTDHMDHMDNINITLSGQDQDHHGQTLSYNTVANHSFSGIPFNLGETMVTVTKGATVVSKVKTLVTKQETVVIKVMTLLTKRKTVVIKVTEVHDLQG